MVVGTQACEATLRACRLRSSTGFVYFKNKTVNYNMQAPIGASRTTSIELFVEWFVMVAGKQACEATLRVCRLRSSTGFVYFKKQNRELQYANSDWRKPGHKHWTISERWTGFHSLSHWFNAVYADTRYVQRHGNIVSKRYPTKLSGLCPVSLARELSR